MKKPFTKREVAAALGVSPSTIDRAHSQGLIRVVNFGRRRVVPADEVERLLRDGLPSVGAYRRMSSRPARNKSGPRPAGGAR